MTTEREGTRSWLEHGQTTGSSTHRVATKRGEQKARQAHMQVLERFMVLIPSGQQADVVIKAKNLIVTYRDLRPEMLTAQEQV